MNAPQRAFPVEIHPKGPFPLLIGLEGPPGGGKTLSALRLAAGIAKRRSGPIRVIDTEAGRSAAYRSRIEFGLIRLQPPFRPGRFLDAIRESIALDNPACIVIDSLSDEHEGEGGVLEWHEEEINRRLKPEECNDYRRREALGQAAWIVPKQDRTRLINGILRIVTPLIFTFRAREKTRPVPQVKNGKTVMVPTRMGYQAIAPAEICHAMTCMCLLPPHADGKPVWRSDEAGQDFLLKRPNFLADILSDAQLDEATGERLAQWAAGGVGSAPAPVESGAQNGPNQERAASPSNDAPAGESCPPAGDESEALIAMERTLRDAAENGYQELRKAWNALDGVDQHIFKALRDRHLIPIAREADERLAAAARGEAT